ncbi:MAG: ribonuclease H-like domain-containing protein [Lachnospiraceae bacterium]|nr:ribonuclease H-like domain-containing protein [Lachnospiraceae bacterium]
MKTIDRILPDFEIPTALRCLSDTEGCGALLNGRRPFFFDIETTGLSPLSCYIYLIGCLVETPEGVRFRQWFAENADEEPAVLTAFCEALTDDCVLVHYNGSTFDIPFVTARLHRHKLSYTIPEKDQTVDLYRRLSACKTLFGLTNRKQPSLEVPAGFERTDPYDGGTLVSFYSEYVARCRFDTARAEELSDALLLHNHDDILGLAKLPSLLPYCLFDSVPFTDVSQTESNGYVTFTATLPYAFPKAVRKVCPLPDVPADCVLPKASDGADCSASADDVQLPDDAPDGYFADLLLSGNTVRLSLPVYSMNAYFYFPNYKDYYYLPYENKAVHKSLASFVEKEYRKPATRETARQQKSGSFLPQLQERIGPVFRFRPGDNLTFFEKRELDREAVGEYLRDWYEYIME